MGSAQAFASAREVHFPRRGPNMTISTTKALFSSFARKAAHFTLPLLTALALTLPSRGTLAEETKGEVDQHVQAALQRFREQVKGAPEYLQAAKAVLVVPEVKKVGLVVGGEWGEGSLRVNGNNVAYYKMDSGSVGLTAGFDKTDFVFVFFTDEALKKFRASNRFSVGADAGVTMVEKEANASADTLKNKAAVAGFAFGESGLMGDVSVKGTKFKRVH